MSKVQSSFTIIHWANSNFGWISQGLGLGVDRQKCELCGYHDSNRPACKLELHRYPWIVLAPLDQPIYQIIHRCPKIVHGPLDLPETHP